MVKLLITGVALYYVFQKVDRQELLNSILETKIGFYLLAILAFNGSKVFSAFRVLEFYRAIGIYLSRLFNLKLYYVGMFYNLFLPGSIGGDGYKVYLLKQGNNKVKTKLLVAATLLDRLSGLAILFLLGGVFFLLSSFDANMFSLDIITTAAIIAVIPVFYLFIKFFFKSFVSAFWKTTFYSVAVQVGQVLTALALLYALSVPSGFNDYLALFMVSSVVAVIPFTVGGVGARELVFLYGFQFLNIEKDKAIAFTLLFFSVTAITALFGLIVSTNLAEAKSKRTVE